MSEFIADNIENGFENNEKEDCIETLMEAYEQIPNKGDLTKDERNLRKEIMSFLYHDKKMRDNEIADFLQVSKSKVRSWRRGESLPRTQEKRVYYRSPEEVERVVRFILLAKSVIKDNSEVSKDKNISLREILDPKS